MSVFKFVITASVISTILVAPHTAAAKWSYPVDKPERPTLIRTKQLTNPTVNEIQQAIAPKTRIDIIGDVDASSGQRLSISQDDVRLNFKRASRVKWSGGDNWGGFIEVSGSRVEILNLDMQVVGSGRCRGVVIHTPASDVRFANCEFRDVADGFIADGRWERIELKNVSFIDCGDWNSNNMDGGYGLFFEEDDDEPDHLRLDNVTVTLANNSGQHGIRLSKVQRLWIDNSFFGANAKRSFWAYGVDHVTIRDTTFDRGSVLFNLKTTELQTERPVRYVRMDNCKIDHRSILRPLAIYCGKGTRYFMMRDMEINSTTADRYLEVSWRDGNYSRRINWIDGSITFNGQQMWGTDGTAVHDWNEAEMEDVLIGPMN